MDIGSQCPQYTSCIYTVYIDVNQMIKCSDHVCLKNGIYVYTGVTKSNEAKSKMKHPSDMLMLKFELRW